MAKRGDKARARFIGWASAYMDDSIRRGNSPEVAAMIGLDVTYEQAEHGGIGIGPGTCRRYRREAKLWRDELLRFWADQTIGRGA